jgi:hypothetical protein
MRSLRSDTLTVIGFASLLALGGCATAPHGSGNARVTLPSMQGDPVVLNNANLPPQGSNFRDQSNRWQVHGMIGNVAYRYTQEDPTHILVATAPGATWTDLTARNSWVVSCVAAAPNIHCAIEAPQAGGAARDLAMVDGFACRMRPGTSNPGSADFVAMKDGRRCVAAGGSNDLSAAYGFREAASLRDWMIRIYQTGRAK